MRLVKLSDIFVNVSRATQRRWELDERLNLPKPEKVILGTRYYDEDKLKTWQPPRIAAQPPAEGERKREGERKPLHRNPSTPIGQLNIGIRTRASLMADGIRTVAELAQRSERDLFRLRYVGATGIGRIKEELRAFGLTLGAAADSPGEERDQM